MIGRAAHVPVLEPSDSQEAKDFVKYGYELSEKYDTLRVVTDQIGTPTYTVDLARLLVDMIETEKFGIYHATNEGGYISWADFAREIFRLAGKSTAVQGVTTEEYGLSRAKRPFNSRLEKKKLREMGFKTCAMALKDDSYSIDDPALRQVERLAVVLGSVGDGLAESTIADCDYTVKIPMYHGVDSLNVAAASAVAFWELRPR